MGQLYLVLWVNSSCLLRMMTDSNSAVLLFIFDCKFLKTKATKILICKLQHITHQSIIIRELTAEFFGGWRRTGMGTTCAVMRLGWGQHMWGWGQWQWGPGGDGNVSSSPCQSLVANVCLTSFQFSKYCTVYKSTTHHCRRRRPPPPLLLYHCVAARLIGRFCIPLKVATDQSCR